MIKNVLLGTINLKLLQRALFKSVIKCVKNSHEHVTLFNDSTSNYFFFIIHHKFLVNFHTPKIVYSKM